MSPAQAKAAQERAQAAVRTQLEAALAHAAGEGAAQARSLEEAARHLACAAADGGRTSDGSAATAAEANGDVPGPAPMDVEAGESSGRGRSTQRQAGGTQQALSPQARTSTRNVATQPRSCSPVPEENQEGGEVCGGAEGVHAPAAMPDTEAGGADRPVCGAYGSSYREGHQASSGHLKCLSLGLDASGTADPLPDSQRTPCVAGG